MLKKMSFSIQVSELTLYIWVPIFLAMDGRTGIIDTAIRTADSGYIARQLIKALEDISVLYDSTVRNTAKRIVQFTYGDDGFNSVKQDF